MGHLPGHPVVELHGLEHEPAVEVIPQLDGRQIHPGDRVDARPVEGRLGDQDRLDPVVPADLDELLQPLGKKGQGVGLVILQHPVTRSPAGRLIQRPGLSQVNFRVMQPPALGDEVAIEILPQGIDLAAIQEGAPPVPQIMAPALLGRGNVPRAHVIDADQEQHHLGPQFNDIILHQDEVPVGGGAIQAGVVDPHPVKLAGEFLAQEVRPGPAVGEVEALRGAAADGDDGQVVPEIPGRRLAPEAQEIFGVDRGLGQFGGKFFRVVKDISFVDRQDDPVGPEADFQGIVDPEQHFQHRQGHQAAREKYPQVFQQVIRFHRSFKSKSGTAQNLSLSCRSHSVFCRGAPVCAPSRGDT